MGVPFEMVTSQGSGNESVRKTIASGRIFTSAMDQVCHHLQELLATVYSKIYRVNRESVSFLLNPMPRLEVETIEDFKVLFEIGALTPDQSLKISQALMGAKSQPYQKALDSTLAGDEGKEGGGGGGFGGSDDKAKPEAGPDKKKLKYNAGGGKDKKGKDAGDPKYI